MTKKSPVGAYHTFGKSKWLSFGGWINAIIPILIVYIFAQKYFKEGLTVGGVKG
jgi:ABC-type glycerol-3-phosphate transport system permease component